MKQLVIGVLAHVDAGKTTPLRGPAVHRRGHPHPGPVDHRDAYLTPTT